MVISLERGANDLHMVQLMLLPPHHLCSSEIQNGLPFWCRLTQVVLEKRPLNGSSSSNSTANSWQLELLILVTDAAVAIDLFCNCDAGKVNRLP